MKQTRLSQRRGAHETAAIRAARIRGLAAWLGLTCGTAASAAGLGELTIHSALGEPLDATVQVIGNGLPLDQACITTTQRPSEPNDDIPTLRNLKAELIRTGDGSSQILLRSRYSINDPIARLVLHMGCGISLTREYHVLPSPKIYPPVEARQPLDSPPTLALAPASAGVLPPPGASVQAPGGTPENDARAAKPAEVVNARGADAAPPAAKVRPKPVAQRSAAKPAAPRPVVKPASPAESDRLKISPTNMTTAPTAAPLASPDRRRTISLAAATKEIETLQQQLQKNDDLRQQEKEAFANLEVQLVTLRRQIDELKLQIANKEATDKRLAEELVAARTTPRGIFHALAESPHEALAVGLAILAIIAASALGSYRLLLRQVTRGSTQGNATVWR